MYNPRITKKEYGLIKGALRRAFSRSEIRKAALTASIIDYADPHRPRVTRWSVCPLCKRNTPTYLMQVDHVEPVIPVDGNFEDMSIDIVVNRMWCDPINLVAICEECHKVKSKSESAQRAALRKLRKGSSNVKSRIRSNVRKRVSVISRVLRHARTTEKGIKRVSRVRKPQDT